jgi:hypothetical protein
MALGRLTVLQERALVALGGIEPRWTLTGGGALAGFHTRHRVTRDLDLFFRGQISRLRAWASPWFEPTVRL